MIKNPLSKLVPIFALGFLLGTTPVFAQLTQDPTELAVILSPASPTSFSNTTIRLENFAINLDAAAIRWIVNGKEVEKGTGIKQIIVQTGAPGIVTTVRVIVQPQEGGTIEKTITLNPAEIDLLWQAETYTPVFYKGKALPSSESVVTIVANPIIKSKGLAISPKNLIYQWKLDGKVALAQSGFGKNTFTFQKILLKEQSLIEVQVSTNDGTISAQKTLSLSDFAPEIHFYDEDPLSGTDYTRALDGGVRLTNNEGTVRAEPFFVSGRSYNDSLFSRTWRINNTPTASETANPLVLTLRSERSTGGTAIVDLSLENKAKLLQNTRKSFTITLD